MPSKRGPVESCRCPATDCGLIGRGFDWLFGHHEINVIATRIICNDRGGILFWKVAHWVSFRMSERKEMDSVAWAAAVWATRLAASPSLAE
jgi:hypothetical protein